MPVSVIEFEKYQGAGDNFVFVDNREGKYDDVLCQDETVAKICDKNFGVGANGLIEMRRHKNYVFEMLYHTNLGNVSQMCGNGSRICITYATTRGVVDKEDDKVLFNVRNDGEHVGFYDAIQRHAFVSMRDIPVVHKLSDTMYLANSGLPHLVVFIDKPLDALDINKEGQALSEAWSRYATDISPVLVNFVQQREDGLHARCYDTGGRQEIISCGTASTAIAVCHAVMTAQDDTAVEDGETVINWAGGALAVKFHREETSFSNLQLGGPICHVFSGRYFLS